MDGFSDAYVKLKLDGHPKQKTKIMKKSLDPEWNQEFRYSTWGTSEKLMVQVWDYTGRITKRVFIGQAVFLHPDQGRVNGSFPLVDQKGDPVGGTIEVSVTCEYLMGLERRASHSLIELKKDTEPIPDTNFTPAAVNPQVFQELQDEQDKVKELERVQKELEDEKEKQIELEKEREEDRKQLEEALKRVAELEEDKKKNSTAIELLEKELAEARQTVSETQESNQKFNCCRFFAQLFPCCISSKKQEIQQITKTETEIVRISGREENIEQPTQNYLDDTVIGSDRSVDGSMTPDGSANGSMPDTSLETTPAGTPEQAHRYLPDQNSSESDPDHANNINTQIPEIPINTPDLVENTV